MRSTKRLLLAIGFSGIFLALMLPGFTAWGQAQAKDLKINYIAPPVPDQASQANEVRAYISVLDADGQPITGLQKDAFKVSFLGQPVNEFELIPSQDPLSIILVIDTSGSMIGPPLGQAKAAAKQFIDILDDKDEVALYSFNLTVTNHTRGFTPDKGAIKNLIGSSEIEVPSRDQWTCLYNALYDAATLAINRPQGRGAIIVLSDGGDIGPGQKQCSTHNVGDVVNKAHGTLVPIYTIGLGSADLATLQALADQTGGRALISPNPADLTTAFEYLGSLLKDQYVLAFKTSQVGSGLLQVSLTDNSSAIDAKSITSPPLPTPIPQPPTVEFEGSYQNTSHAFVFTATLRPNPASNAEITGARWYVDNGQQGVISDAQAAAVLVYSVFDSAGACRLKPNPHDLRIEVTDEKGNKGEKSGIFAITENMCPSPPNALLIGIAGVVLLALAGVIFVMRRQSQATVVYGKNLSDQTEEAEVAWLRLMGGAQAADGKTELPMTKDIFRIGRGADNDLCLEEKKVSRKHAEIHFNSVTRTFTLFDCNSLGGTRVNDKFIKANSEVLTDNATIVVGTTNILFELARGESPRASTGDTTEDEDRTEMEP